MPRNHPAFFRKASKPFTDTSSIIRQHFIFIHPFHGDLAPQKLLILIFLSVSLICRLCVGLDRLRPFVDVMVSLVTLEKDHNRRQIASLSALTSQRTYSQTWFTQNYKFTHFKFWKAEVFYDFLHTSRLKSIQKIRAGWPGAGAGRQPRP